MQKPRPLLLRAWVIWLVAVSFYSYEFFLRISPSVMIDELMRDFAIDATLLGSLSAFYYYAYASLQIPVGALLDRFGIRYLLALAAIVVSLGCFLYAHAYQFWIAELSRILMGLGSAFSFIACLKLITNWFENRYTAMIIGLTNTLGVLGAISGGAPLAILVDHIGWREVMSIAGLLGLVIAGLIWLVIRENPSKENQTEVAAPHRIWEGLSHVMRSPQTWLVACVGGLMVAPVSAFTELWSVPFLSLSHHVIRSQAALLASLMFVGIAIGGPIHGFISGRLGRRKPVMLVGVVGELVCLALVIYAPIDNLYAIGALLVLFGFFTSSMLLCFAINTELQPTWATGITIGFTNTLVMIGGTIFQPLVGYMLDKTWGGELVHGEHVFTLANYQTALVLLLISLGVAFVLIGFMRETYCCKCDENGLDGSPNSRASCPAES